MCAACGPCGCRAEWRPIQSGRRKAIPAIIPVNIPVNIPDGSSLPGCVAVAGFRFGIACSEGCGNSSSLRVGDWDFGTWPESVRT